ncbi:MAG: hypothetical protein V1727_00340 [Candidatus Omnitrophota bacterium]
MNVLALKKNIWCVIISCGVSALIFLAVHAEDAPAKATWPQVSYSGENVRDPFLSPFELGAVATNANEKKNETKPTLPHLEVQGLIWGTKLPQAIINNQIIRPGDTISGAEILDVRKEGVYVLYGGYQFILRPAVLDSGDDSDDE